MATFSYMLTMQMGVVTLKTLSQHTHATSSTSPFCLSALIYGFTETANNFSYYYYPWYLSITDYVLYIGNEERHKPPCSAVVSTLVDVANEAALVNRFNACCKEETVKTIVLKHSTQIQQCLNFTVLLPMLTNPEISFLTQDELQFVINAHTDTQKANNLLQLLTQKPISAS